MVDTISIDELKSQDDVKEFYDGQSIFITGATGFMGKVLVEKLLWSCTGVKEIFLLMRPKKGMNIDERLKKMLTLPLFDRIRKDQPKYFEKLIPVSGDICEEGLGLSPVERQFLIEKVSIIFHVAASVRFDDPLKDAIFTNTRSTRDICILASSMKKLVAFMHVSSTYSHTDKYVVDEKLYPFDVDWKQAVKIAENVDDETLKILTPKFLESFPNTYTFAKRLAESVCVDYAGILPIVVMRPSIVISTCREPVPGWLDNFNGPVGLMVGGGKGILRVVHLASNHAADFIPVDIAIKAMIIATWQRGKITITKDPDIHVYNCSSADIKSMSFQEIVQMGLRITDRLPLEDVLWYPRVIVTTKPFIYYILTLFLHLLPGVIIDTCLQIAGKPPILVKLQRKIYAANRALNYFLTNEWKFKNGKLLGLLTLSSIEHTDLFEPNYATFDVNKYFEDCIIGAKVYLFKENMQNLKKAKKHSDRMYWIDIFCRLFLLMAFAWFLVHFNIPRRSVRYFRSILEIFL